MKGNSSNNITPKEKEKIETQDAIIVKTDEENHDGQNKCPKCGATDISLNLNTGKLRCNFCRHEFDAKKVDGLNDDVKNLSSKIIGSGATNIIPDTKDVLTFKCESCGASVVIDTKSSVNARCHWCRNILSVNEQIPNGAIPDVVLPFKLTKDAARGSIEKFVGKRKFFANPKFRHEFTTENIMGVYFPYMIVDANSHANFTGQAEKLLSSYTVKVGDSTEMRYDAEVFEVKREFDLAIKGLTVESSVQRLDNDNKNQTNNVINAIMPFDTENAVKYDANYLRGFTSEKRDMNVDGLENLVQVQAKDIARFAANETLKEYDRGVAWSKQEFSIKGEQWISSYLPVWLYSYQEVKDKKKILHYVAVNARTGETMGSVPIHMPKLIAISCLIEALSVYLMIVTSEDFDGSWIFLAIGIIFFIIMYHRYRNQDARHTHETETKKEMSNLVKYDKYVTRRNGLHEDRIEGANNTDVYGSTVQSTFTKDTFKAIPGANEFLKQIKDVNDKLK